MKKNDKRRRAMAGLDIMCVVLAIVSGISHFLESRDWAWICWVVIVLCLEVRIWLTQEELRREKEKAETYFKLYNRASMDLMDLAWENDCLRNHKAVKEDVE